MSSDGAAQLTIVKDFQVSVKLHENDTVQYRMNDCQRC